MLSAYKNIARILEEEGVQNTLVIVSAMGKMTNALEEVVHTYYNKSNQLNEKIVFVEHFHKKIVQDLFPKNALINKEIDTLLQKLYAFLKKNTVQRYNYIYDQVVCFGELLSTKIVSAYLKKAGIENNWLDVRNCIKTDSNYRNATVNWKDTQQAIQKHCNGKKLQITQGFLASNAEEYTTTLGREGSDYTAGIFAYCLDAQSVTIWKDVAGVLNADPRIFSKTTLLKQISYEETIEMAFYGASVIHPKTIQPLQSKNIPLYIRSFKNRKKTGTKVSRGVGLSPFIPCFIVKKNQILISIATKDFSFMVENNISYIFQKLHQYQLTVHVIQNSAISFSVCVEDTFNTFMDFYQHIQSLFTIHFEKQVDLYTIRHFNKKAIRTVSKKRHVLLTQINKETAQLVLR